MACRLAITRQTSEGEPVGGFIPQQRLSLEDTIRGYTLGAAFAGRREKTEGSLEPGKLADFILLDRDLFKIEPSEIDKTEVLLTMVGGKVVYQSPNWKDAFGRFNSIIRAKQDRVEQTRGQHGHRADNHSVVAIPGILRRARPHHINDGQ
jgi:hypothetical protein